MKNKRNYSHRVRSVSFFVIALSLISCEAKREPEDSDLRYHVYDDADFLNQYEEELLSNYFDSLERTTGWQFVYSAVNNFGKDGFDSLASTEFKKFPIEENGALIFLSRSDASVKILVGKQLHSLVSNAELSEITEALISHFKLGRFYQGLRNGAREITTLGLSVSKYRTQAVTDQFIPSEYHLMLLDVLKNVHGADDSLVLHVIPTSAEESLIYFSSDYSKDSSMAFQTLQSRIVTLCVEGNGDILKKYLYLSEFVDGYFAEDYFDNIEKIMKHQQALTCSTLSSSSSGKIKRLTNLRNQYCN